MSEQRIPEPVMVRVDPVERDAIRWAIRSLERYWQAEAATGKSTSTHWSLPDWYDDLRRLYQRIEAAERGD